MQETIILSWTKARVAHLLPKDFYLFSSDFYAYAYKS